MPKTQEMPKIHIFYAIDSGFAVARNVCYNNFFFCKSSFVQPMTWVENLRTESKKKEDGSKNKLINNANRNFLMISILLENCTPRRRNPTHTFRPALEFCTSRYSATQKIAEVRS